MRSLETVQVEADKIREHPQNPRKGDVEAIKESMQANGVYRPVIVQKSSGYILAGNHTYRAMRELGETLIPVVFVDVDDDTATRILLADNKTAELAKYDDKALAELLENIPDLDGTGFDERDLDALLLDLHNETEAAPSQTLADTFGVFPASIFDTTTGTWRARKQEWENILPDSREGRDAQTFDSFATMYVNWGEVRDFHLANNPDATAIETAERYANLLIPYKAGSGISQFDPVLAEILTRWFTPKDGTLIDPWAGGSVRGLVAAICGRNYAGIDINPTQVETNRQDVADLKLEDRVWYTLGDSLQILRTLDADKYDGVVACPPYYDLEQYTNDPADLSNLSAEDFDKAMIGTFKELDRVLAPDRFSCFVISSVRDKKGYQLDMRDIIKEAAKSVGWRLVNTAVLVNQIGGTGAMRAAQNMRLRSLVRRHQDVMIYVKGDRKRASEKCGEIDAFTLESFTDKR